LRILNSIKGLDVAGEMVEAGCKITLRKKMLVEVNQVLAGTGIIRCYNASGYSRVQWCSRFDMADPEPVEFQPLQDGLSVTIPNLPFSGFMTREKYAGYIAAPAVRLDVPMGRDVIVMLLRKKPGFSKISADEYELEVSDGEDRAKASLIADNDKLRIAFSASGSGFKNIRLEMHRAISPAFLPAIPAPSEAADAIEMKEVLAILDGAGQADFTWKPVARDFEDILLAFYPLSYIDRYKADRARLRSIMEPMGAEFSTGSFMSVIFGRSLKTDFVMGDGTVTNFTLSLIMDKGLGKRSIASTNMYLI
jgi:hypothetical protein